MNGTSSSGKSEIARALKPILPASFCYFSSDQLAEAGFRAADVSPAARLRFFDGFHRAVGAFASVGNDLLVEHIVEEMQWATDLANMLAVYDVFWVGVHCDLALLEKREAQRGDRAIGEARFHMKTHQFQDYDFEVDGSQEACINAQMIKDTWEGRNL